MEPRRPTLRRRVASIVGVLAAVAVGGTLWWAVPCELTLDVRVPDGTKCEVLGAAVLRRRAGHLTDEILQDGTAAFPDRIARDTSFRFRLPRGEYRIVVSCEDTQAADERIRRVDERFRLATSRTVLVPLAASAGNEGRVIK